MYTQKCDVYEYLRKLYKSFVLNGSWLFYLKKQQALIWSIYDLSCRKNLINLTFQPVFDCVVNRFIFPRVTVIFFSTYTHHLYLNNFDEIDDQYFDENKSIYKEDVLRVLRHLVLPVDENEDPATLDKEAFLLKYSDAVDHLCEIRYYMGYKVGEHVFYGLNSKSVADTEKLLENNFNINFKLELFIPETGHGLHTSMFLYFYEKEYKPASVQQGPRMMDDNDFPYSTKLMYLLSLSTEK